MSDYIFFHNISSLTGKELKKELHIDGGTTGPESKPNKMIRWGNSAESRYSARDAALNKKDALNNAADKERALQLMASANVKVPPHATRFEGDLLIGRTSNHTQGSGAFLITSQRDFDLASRNLHCTHFMAYVPTEREYRAHVFRGKVIAMAEKRMGNNATSLHIRNFETGWTFHYFDAIDQNSPECKIAIDAIRALGLDFGGVDIIKSVNGNVYVLEVNTAPSLVKEIKDASGNITSIEHGPAFNTYLANFRAFLNGQ
jgi:glutathione synthase/RimK-type ligase-like ATP-grasp enzyme